MNFTTEQRKGKNRIILTMLGFVLLLGFLFYDEKVNEMNTTMLAFSYEYGFISRGFVGTIFQLLVNLFPFMELNYASVMFFTKCVTAVFFLIILHFFGFCLKKTFKNSCISKTMQHYTEYFMILYLLFAVPFSVTNYNFGRTDIWLAAISIICIICIIKEKFAWLTIPLCAIAIMIHQGFAFMFMNTIMILLFYKILSCRGKERLKLIIILSICIILSASLFFWFELFSHANGENVYEKLVYTATELSAKGKIHIDVIDKEILGIDLTDRETEFHLQNLVQFPIFILLMTPYIIYACQFFLGVIRESNTILEKIKYICLAAGSLTIIPLLLLKVDFGRWMFAVIHYYLIMLLAMIAMGDKLIIKHIEKMISNIRTKCSFATLLLVYPIILQPLRDVSICKLTAKIAGIINEYWLHWW